jgi:hypothetical protein
VTEDEEKALQKQLDCLKELNDPKNTPQEEKDLGEWEPDASGQ